MAADKLIDSTKEAACRTAEANAIRSKTGSSAQISYDFANNKGFADAISAIPSGGGGKNIQYYAGLKSIEKTSLSSTGVKVTVEKTGNYKISWMAARGSSSGTMSTRLYVNGSAKDTDRTTWTQTYGQQITISSFSLTAGQTVEIYARSGSTSRQVMVGQLVIEEL